MHARSEATRRTILESAARVFDRHGFAGASISAICREAGLTSGAVYFHFSCKDKLALAVVEEHFASWPALIAAVSQLPATALQRIIILSYEVARAFRDDIIVRAGSRLWTERLAIAVAMPPPFVGWIDTLAAILRQAVADGSVDPDADPEAAATVLVCAFYGTHIVSDALDDRVLIEQRLGQLWHLFLPGLRRDGTPSEILRETLIAARGPAPVTARG